MWIPKTPEAIALVNDVVIARVIDGPTAAADLIYDKVSLLHLMNWERRALCNVINARINEVMTCGSE